MTPKKEETKLILDILKALEAEELQKAFNSIKGARLQGASKETDSISGKDRFIKAMWDSCEHVPDKRTKQEKKIEGALRKKVIDFYIENQSMHKGSPIKNNTKILNQIKELKFSKVILIIGENLDLAEAVASCIFSTYLKFYCHTLHKLSLTDGKYTARESTFKSQSYVGWDEVDIKDHLFLSQNPNPLIDHFKRHDILFLRGINDKKILERLIDTAREYRFLHGFLIINTNKADIISQEFLDKTEIIYLKTTLFFKDDASTVIINDKIFTDLQEKEYKLLKLLYNKKSDIANYKEIKENVFGSSTSEQQIHNTISNLKKKFDKYVDIENKRGVGYMLLA